MDQIFDRLGNLLKSIFQEDESSYRKENESADPDMQAAWDELDDFMKSGEDSAPRKSSGSGVDEKPPIPEALKQDYVLLEVPVGASIEKVTKSYKRLMRQYHPDKHASDPKLFDEATEITKKINFSYQRVRRYDKTGQL